MSLACAAKPSGAGRDAVSRARLAAAGLVGSSAVLLLRPVLPLLARYLPPCPVHLYLGLLCPGCGATRASLALLQGQPLLAWQLNPLFVLVLPLLLAYLAVTGRRLACGHPHPWPALPRCAAHALLLACAGFAVWRNL